MSRREPVPEGTARFVHQALVYRADEELLRLAVPFLRSAAEAGEPALIAMGGRHERALMEELREVEGITPLHPYHYHDPLSALHDEHRLFAHLVRNGARRVRIVSEVPHDPWTKWFRYVAATNDVFARFPVVSLCPHDLRTTSVDVLLDVARTHPFLVGPNGTVVRSHLYKRPSSLLAERARTDVDPLEARRPPIVLVDPVPDAARRAVSSLVAVTRLGSDGADAVRLAAGHVVDNAIVHGRPPVRLAAWADPDRVVVTVTDQGSGPAEPYMALLPGDPDADLDEANSLYVISQAVSDVSLFHGPDGFTVRLVERA
jgi:anti-sigma regulatory factor (Ser/Thr protein kinase)